MSPDGSTDDTGWQRQAACANHPEPDLWFPTPGRKDQVDQAEAVCHDCKISRQCLRYAVVERIDDGIRGGLTANERRGMSLGRRRIFPIKHGTPGGPRAHRRRGEEPCDECKSAHALYEQMRVEKKAAGDA